MNKKKIRVVLGLSGGVDSSVCSYLLKEQGYEVIAIFMRNWDSLANNDILGNKGIKDILICPEEKEWSDAQQVAKSLDIPIYREDFIDEYWEYVFKNLIDEYKKGKTPNPDILCNKFIKFGVFFKKAKEKYNADLIATGHYARIINKLLCKSNDLKKDQSYFLAQVDKECFNDIIFPLADLNKKQVRSIANKINLITANKKDSTGICFIGERNFTKFLQNYIPIKPGDIIDITTNKKIGTHDGVMYYTIGQRKGLNLGGMSEPYYVAGHDIKKRIIYVAPQSREEYLLSDKCLLKDINILADKYLSKKGLTAKFRYRQKDISINVIQDNDKLYVEYKEGCKAITPGQQCVIYYKDICVAGGIIDIVYKDNIQIKHL